MQQDRHDPCRWVLGRIEARSKEKLALKIIPKQSKPFELAVRWDFKPAPSQAMIEVQEPKLTMRLDGPREVLFGKREVLQAEAGQQRQRRGRERRAHAHAAECRRHASDHASPGHDQRRRRADRSKSN